MFRIAFFATIAAACFTQSADAQLNFIDAFYDYKIEIRQRSKMGQAVFYDTHAPISNPLHQINRQWRAFQSREEADEFFAANPEYEILDRNTCWIDESDWIEVDEVDSFDEAKERESEIRQKNWQVETRIIPVFTPAQLYKHETPKLGFQPWL